MTWTTWAQPIRLTCSCGATLYTTFVTLAEREKVITEWNVAHRACRAAHAKATA